MNIHQRAADSGLTMRNTRTTSLPIACTLSAGDYHDRLTWIATLNRELLRSHQQKDLELELVYELDAAARVRALVQQEQACCAFLHFTITEATDTLTLRIEVPAEAGDHAAEIFAPFLEGAAERR